MYGDLLGQIASGLCDRHETSRVRKLVDQGVRVMKIIEE